MLLALEFFQPKQNKMCCIYKNIKVCVLEVSANKELLLKNLNYPGQESLPKSHHKKQSGHIKLAASNLPSMESQRVITVNYI